MAGPIQTDDDRDASYVTTKVRFITPQFWSGTSTTGFRGDLVARVVGDALVRPEPGIVDMSVALRAFESRCPKLEKIRLVLRVREQPGFVARRRAYA